MKFDLHIHSCLSPCANLEMSPEGLSLAREFLTSQENG